MKAYKIAKLPKGWFCYLFFYENSIESDIKK